MESEKRSHTYLFNKKSDFDLFIDNELCANEKIIGVRRHVDGTYEADVVATVYPNWFKSFFAINSA